MITPTPKRKRNHRTAGNNYELTVMHWFRSIGFKHLVTSRSESHSRDDQKIDLINKDEAINGRIPYDIQCKNVSQHLKYKAILDEIKPKKNIIRVIFHKLTEKTGKTKTIFVHKGHYAILHAEDFLKMVAELEKLRQYHASAERDKVPTIALQPKKNGTELY